jgi:fatty-acyl-CoA synthase
MIQLAHVGEMLALHARLFPDKIGASDLDRKMTFRLWHSRACRLANALSALVSGKAIASACSPIIAWNGWRYTPPLR